MNAFYRMTAVGRLGANAILLGRENAVLIDPGAEPEMIAKMCDACGAAVSRIVLTHAHFDHIGAAALLAERTGAELLIHGLDAEGLQDPFLNLSAAFGRPLEAIQADGLLSEGDLIPCGTGTLRVLHTPGHTPGSICLLWREGDSTVLVSGDTLFDGGYGRTDLPGGNYSDLRASVARLDSEIPKGTLVLPGHGNIFTKG